RLSAGGAADAVSTARCSPTLKLDFTLARKPTPLGTEAGTRGLMIIPRYTRPDNGHIESFHDKLRDECLNRELFGTFQEERVVLESWRVEYNECRPHSALGYLTAVAPPVWRTRICMRLTVWMQCPR